MREIKFRGRRVDNGEWVEGSLITKITPKEVEPVFWTTLIHDGALTAVEVDPATVGQFTGLLDKNGRDWYQGDLVRVNNEAPIHVTYWDENEMGWKIRLANSKSYWFNINAPLFEIIGNIHENPELL